MNTLADFAAQEPLGYLLHRTALAMRRELSRAFKARGYAITPDQLIVLGSLWRSDGQTQKELADGTFKDMPNITRILDGLQRRKLLVRREHEGDRRSFRVFTTPEGMALMQKLVPVLDEVNRKASTGLTPREIARFKELLKKIYGNVS